MTMNRRSGRTLVVTALLAGGLLVTGCGTQQAGSAAILGDSRITEQQLNTQVREVLLAQRKPADAADQVLTSKTLGRMITTELANTLAEQNGVVVTQGEIDEQLVQYDAQLGDRAAVLQAFAEQDIAPSQIESVVRLNLQAQALGIKLDPQGSAESQGQAVFDAVNALSDDLEVTASPRFGTWDSTSLSIGPALDDLSAPPALAQ
ncbi:MAG: SurA N-terminal domain-containing protein [Actinobacteria bacterium]|jgi:peptidyl-prolyl cis-trans isomerase SurA|nr:SurA N-terminal domain-containing protein [Actinomycetota bacterium]